MTIRAVDAGRPPRRAGRPAEGSGPTPDIPPDATTVDEPDAVRLGLRLAFVAVLAFLPALGCGWVNWDDTANFLVNPWFQGLTWAHARWAWSATVLGVYQPLSWLMLQGEYSLWGFAPRGYHAVSLAWHAANVVLLHRVGVALVRVARPLLAGADPARIERAVALAVALFAVHPLRAESVAWASAQPYLPAAFFALASLRAYLKAAEPDRPTRSARRWLVAAWVAYAVALMFKAVAISLPIVFVLLDVSLLDHWRNDGAKGSSRRRFVLEKLPFVTLAALMALVAMTSRPVRPAGLESRLAAAAGSVWFYPIKTLWPFGLRALYAPADGASFALPQYRLAAAGVVLATLAALATARRRPALAVGWLAYLVVLAPNAGLVRIIAAVAADRYSYVATMPLFLVGGGALAGLGIRRARSLAAGLGLVLIPVLGGLSWFQTATWTNSEMLWAHAVEQGADGSALAHHNLAEAYSELDRLDDAALHYRRAAALQPGLPMSHLNLGMTLARLGRLSDSLGPLANAIRLDPRNAAARLAFGLSLLRLGRLREAETRLRESILLDPTDGTAHNDLGLALLRQGRASEAARSFAEALRLDPQLAEARTNLDAARAAGRTGQPPA